MGELKEYANEFETISESIVRYLFKDVDAEIVHTDLKKDGGYDIIVNYQQGHSIKRALFECKLRSGNLNLRDIAANVIIAFNHGAIALVAITNYDFTQQTGEELIDFCQHTILNIKILIGEDLQYILKKSNIDITEELYNYIDVKKNLRKDDFKALRINLDENILNQIFSTKTNYQTERNILIEQLFSDKVKYISTALKDGRLIEVTGYLGVGKSMVIEEALKRVNSRIITIDATLYETRDLIILDMLAQIWGMPTVKVFSFFSKKDISSIVEMVGDKYNEKDTIELLTALLDKECTDRHISAIYNVLICDYIINLLVLHEHDIGFAIYIKNLQFVDQEIYDFLIYFSKCIADKSIGGVISYQEPEYELQESRNISERLCHIEKYDICQIELLNKDEALFYITALYPELPLYIAKLIVSRVGTKLYNLLHLLKSLFPDDTVLPMDSNAIIERLQYCTPNNVPNLLAQSLMRYKDIYSTLFELCYLFECRVPIEICNLIENISQDIEHMAHIGIFYCSHGILIAQNEFVHDWIMHAYSNNSPSIQILSAKLLKVIQPNTYNVGYINMYRFLGYNREALALLDKNLFVLKKEKQYTPLKKGLIQAIDISRAAHNYVMEIKYLVQLLEIITIKKEIVTKEAEQYIARLKHYSQFGGFDSEYKYALDFFIFKRDFKLGAYTKPENASIQEARNYYEKCVCREFTNNVDDWLGRICSCYALFVKSTQSNETAKKVFENSLEVFPDSFDLRREYYSHIGCMQLFEKPQVAFDNYQKILNLFEKEMPDSAALPFHEYGDLAMSQLVAKNFEYAHLLVDNALEIVMANGLLDEEGRGLNIRGCIEWCQGDLGLAESSFREATTIMNYSGYTHYVWRSQLNSLQLSLIMGTYCDITLKMLEDTYALFLSLLSIKIESLAKSDSAPFRKTIEYHALIVFGFLWNELAQNEYGYLKICKDFKLGKHNELYQKDVCSFLHGDYNFMDSPYLQNGYIFFVG